MAPSRKQRIAIGPVEIAGYYTNLARGFEELGYECGLLTVAPHAFQYRTSSPRSRFERLALAAARRSHPSSPRGIRWALRLPVNLFSRTLLVAQAAARYDVFVFACGDSWLRGLELPLLKLLGKQIVFVFHGSDSRPPYINGKSVQLAGTSPGVKLARGARRTRRRLAWVHTFSDAIIDSPLSGHLHDRPFVNWFRVGIPYACDRRIDELVSMREESEGVGRIRIVHAPSDPESKGTPTIERAIERARARGFAIDFVALRGRPNSEVLEELARCDFVIDQLYSDVPGAGLAFEAAALGKPSIVCGYGAHEFERWISPDMVLPTHYCRPEELHTAIDRLLSDATYRSQLGARAREFVRTKCSPAAVAERMLRVLCRDDLGDWYVDPDQITYVHGTGLAEPAAREAVRAVIETVGEAGLQLSNKVGLMRRLLSFAYDERPLSHSD